MTEYFQEYHGKKVNPASAFYSLAFRHRQLGRGGGKLVIRVRRFRLYIFFASKRKNPLFFALYRFKRI